MHHYTRCGVGGSEGLRPSVPFSAVSGEHRSATSFRGRHTVAKRQRQQRGIRKRLDCFCQTFSCATKCRKQIKRRTRPTIALNAMRADGEKGERSPSGLAATSPSVRTFIYLYGRLRLIWQQFLRRSNSQPKFSQIRFNRSVLVCAWACLRRGEAEPLSYQDKPTHRSKIKFYNQKI